LVVWLGRRLLVDGDLSRLGRLNLGWLVACGVHVTLWDRSRVVVLSSGVVWLRVLRRILVGGILCFRQGYLMVLSVLWCRVGPLWHSEVWTTTPIVLTAGILGFGHGCLVVPRVLCGRVVRLISSRLIFRARLNDLLVEISSAIVACGSYILVSIQPGKLRRVEMVRRKV